MAHSNVRRGSRLWWTLVVLGGMAGLAQAQASRTWVSGVGDDANPCSRTAPCKTFAGAISKTAAHGEINVLDPGGFGAVTITKPITIDGGGGVVASILSASVNGIIINTMQADAVVVLRNLQINGFNTGLSGVKVLQAGNVRLQNVKIERTTAACVDVAPTAQPVQVLIQDSVFSHCNDAVHVVASAKKATVAIDRSRLLFATRTGVRGDGALADVLLSNSVVFGNGLGLNAMNGASIQSGGGNQVHGNTSAGTFTGTVAAQ
jgi:hypothetical protein